MEANANVLLALFAVQQAGGTKVLQSEEPIKTIKKFALNAADQDFLKKIKVEVPALDKQGKPTFDKKGNPKTKKVDGFAITESGLAYLKEHGSAESVAVALNQGYLQQLKKEIEADRIRLVDEVQKALAAKTKPGGNDTIRKDIDAMAKTVQQLAERLENIEKATQESGSDATFVTKLEEGFRAIAEKLQKALHSSPTIPTTPTANVAPTVSNQPVTETSAYTEEQLIQTIHETYERLCKLRRYESGFVEIPELYDQVRANFGQLDVYQFHECLLNLEKQDQIEIRTINRGITELEEAKSIVIDNTIYFYVLWK